jgi:putative tryptophan/tyrosine transport system permease protein
VGVWLGALTLGLGFAFLAWAVFLSLRVLRFADISVDGTFTTGAAVASIAIVRGLNPLLATLLGFGAGMIGGAITGLIHTKARVNDLLSGILVMTAAYSINLHIMGGSNIALLDQPTLMSAAQAFGLRLDDTWEPIASFALIALVVGVGMAWFLRTDLGLALRATGDNEGMIAAQAVDTGKIKLIGLSLSNGLAALSGALVAQYYGFVDISMGIGSLVAGIASVILGETLFGRGKIVWLVGAVMLGAVGYRMIVALAINIGVNPNDLRLLTAVFVLVALALPGVRRRFRRSP